MADESTVDGSCDCGCGAPPLVTGPQECTCGCSCCTPVHHSREAEIDELERARAAIDRRLVELHAH